jgi:hypothetical protein
LFYGGEIKISYFATLIHCSVELPFEIKKEQGTNNAFENITER